MTQKADVVICGAGIAGIAAAYCLANDQGITNIVVVDSRAPLTLTSDKSGECYRNWWPKPAMTRLMNRSIDLMEGLAAESNNIFQMNRRGYAYVRAGDDAISTTRQYLKQYEKLDVGEIRIHEDANAPYAPSPPEGYAEQPIGADVLLGRELVEKHYPYLAPEVQTVIHTRRCGWLSAQQLGMYMLEQARAKGVRELRGKVVSIEQDGQGVAAVQVDTADGTERIETRTFVNAAGPFFNPIAEMLGINDLPVYSILHHKLAFRDHLGVIPRDAPFVIYLNEQHLNWSDEEKDMLEQSEEDRWLLKPFPGAFHVRPEGGEDSPWIVLGWAYNDQVETPVESPVHPDEFPDVVVRGSVRAVSAMEGYVNRIPTPMMYDGGYYTKTKENMPLIGPMGVEGAYMIGALSGYGIMVGCSAGELLGHWIANRSALMDDAKQFTLERYDDPDYVATLASSVSGEL